MLLRIVPNGDLRSIYTDENIRICRESHFTIIKSAIVDCNTWKLNWCRVSNQPSFDQAVYESIEAYVHD